MDHGTDKRDLQQVAIGCCSLLPSSSLEISSVWLRGPAEMSLPPAQLSLMEAIMAQTLGKNKAMTVLPYYMWCVLESSA